MGVGSGRERNKIVRVCEVIGWVSWIGGYGGGG